MQGVPQGHDAPLAAVDGSRGGCAAHAAGNACILRDGGEARFPVPGVYAIRGFGDTELVGAKAAAPQAWKIARALYPQNAGPWFVEPPGAAALGSGRPGAVRAGVPAAPRRVPLTISKPENGAVFCLVPGVPQQKIVCQVIGNPESSRLWWFADGVPSGETKGLAPKVFDLGPGKHTVVCATADGVTSEVSFRVTAE